VSGVNGALNCVCDVVCTQADGDGAEADAGGRLGRNILMLTNLHKSATYTCVASSDLGNIAYDVDVTVKGSFTLHT